MSIMRENPKNIIRSALAQSPRANDNAMQNRILAKIRAGELSIAPRQSLVLLRRMLLALQGVMVVLTVGAVVALVRAVQAQETLVFMREFLTALDEYRSLAWNAFVESLPLATLSIAAIVAAGLVCSLLARRYLTRENLIS